MAMWPTSLPKPLAAGYAVEPGAQSIRTDMQVGASRTRRITATRGDMVSAAVLLTDAQLTTFRDWFDDAAQANGGAAWFSVALGVGQGGLTTVNARIVQHSIEAATALKWRVMMKLEVQDA